MAIVDNPEWLLSHIRHAFITSDDTGMCEMCMQDNDLIPLSELRKKLRDKKQQELAAHQEGSSTKSSNDDSKMYKNTAASCSTSPSSVFLQPPSPDIQTGWDFAGRRRSNTAQKLERIRQERQNRIKVKTIRWEENEESPSKEDMAELFKKKIIIKKNKVASTPSSGSFSRNWDDLLIESSSVDSSQTVKDQTYDCDIDTHPCEVDAKPLRSTVFPKKMSFLSKQLQSSNHDIKNPFRDYARFNGRGHGNMMLTQSIDMFVYAFGASAPVGPLKMVILKQGSKVMDLVGLTCWHYKQEGHTPELRQNNVTNYSVKIAEDDGGVDEEFPVLMPYDPIAKFSFPTLALIEKRPTDEDDDAENGIIKSLFVKINHYDGPILVQVNDLSVTMGEIMEKAMKQSKKLYVGKYKLEYQDKEGVAVKSEQTLDSTGAMEFYLVREHSSRTVSKTTSTWESSIEPELVVGEDDIFGRSGIIFK